MIFNVTSTVVFTLTYLCIVCVIGHRVQVATPKPEPTCENGKYYDRYANRCCTKCPAGTHVKEYCGKNIDDTICTECPDGSYTAYPNWLRHCLSCRGPCDSTMKESKKCSSDTDRVCVCGNGRYCALKGSNGGCRYCAPHTKCPPGKGVKVAGTQNDDVVCSPCPDGTFSNITSSTDTCKNHTQCPPGEGVYSPGTQKDDVVCSPCPDGTFSNITSSTAKCVGHSPCPPGEGIIVAGTKKDDVLCKQCPDGTFANVTSGSCNNHTKCPPGQGVSRRGNNIDDVVCQNCPHNTYSNTTSSTDTCTGFTSCPIGSGVDVQGTPYSDVICTLCGHGTYSSKDSDVDPCHPHSRCDGIVVSAGTSTSDVECDDVSYVEKDFYKVKY
ncbi:TNF receptor-like protein [Sea otter poxvirus]|uniref:TNF receptor-like protein n=1 Tax=Sea otter poxvirus TaxID=1416741 RepID=A0A2U9QHJ9_9POXV|nr:TNF receptor-like protein [Sea otter poxvirus]AWU47080.1 TNF receptor-like protein [Sea otter poxvirus]